MKNVIALGLMVVCLGLFSLGCSPKAADPAPATGGAAAPAAGSTETAPETPAQ